MASQKVWDVVGSIALIGFFGFVMFVEDILQALHKFTGGI